MKTHGWQPQREKKRRAFTAYLALLDTAEWIRFEMNRQLEGLGFSLMEFRVMQALVDEGPKHQLELCRKLRRSRQNIGVVIGRLEWNGWVERVPSKLRSSRREDSERDARRGKRSEEKFTGRRVVLIRPTAEGKEKFIDVFTKHAKVVKTYMCTLEGREQLTLTRLCEKLRNENWLRFYKEITRVDFEDQQLRSADLALRSVEK